jgi:multicomponent Na+:H+ antiporter subunit B
MIRPFQSIIVVRVSRWLARLIQIFAIYVICHGHYSPGGGFQGGALLGASILLLRMTEGRSASQGSFKTGLGLRLGALGVLIFGAVGLLPVFFGGNYLDYGHLPFGTWEAARVRSLAILLVEVGVGLAVMAVLISIFDDLVEERGHE